MTPPTLMNTKMSFKDLIKSILAPFSLIDSSRLISLMVMMLQNTQSLPGRMFSKLKNYYLGINANNFSIEPSNIYHIHTKSGTCIWRSTLIFAAQDPFTPKSMRLSMICSRELCKNSQKCLEFGWCTQKFYKSSTRFQKPGLFSTGHSETCLWPNIKKYGKSFLFGPWN